MRMRKDISCTNCGRVWNKGLGTMIATTCAIAAESLWQRLKKYPARPRSVKLRRVTMLWTILMVLLTLWLLGMVGGIGGSLIHTLLVIAALVLVIKFAARHRVAT